MRIIQNALAHSCTLTRVNAKHFTIIKTHTYKNKIRLGNLIQLYTHISYKGFKKHIL